MEEDGRNKRIVMPLQKHKPDGDLGASLLLQTIDNRAVLILIELLIDFSSFSPSLHFAPFSVSL